MKPVTPLVVLVLGGAAERRGCPAAESPLGRAVRPNLDRLAAKGRVFSVRLCESDAEAATAAPVLRILGIDPRGVATARASYVACGRAPPLGDGECYVSADFVTVFRDLLADGEPGPFRPAETQLLLQAAREPLARAGFRIHAGDDSHHIAVAPRAFVDPGVPPPERIAGKPLAAFEPQLEPHALAHKLSKEALDGHEVNEVRRDLGENGADMLWLWGPGGAAQLPDLPGALRARASAVGQDAVFKGVCRAAGVPVRETPPRDPTPVADEVARALETDAICFVYSRRGIRDALARDLGLRAQGLAALDEMLVGPVARRAEAKGARLLVLADVARDTRTGAPLSDAVPALLVGPGVPAISPRPFTEEAAEAAGDPLEPGHGLLAYVRSL